MAEEHEDALADEYAAQQAGEETEKNVPSEGKTEDALVQTKSETELLVDISETLHLLGEQLVQMNEVTKNLPKTAASLTAAAATAQCISWFVSNVW